MPIIDEADMRKHAVVQGFSSYPDTLKWFWICLGNFSNEERARLLQFVTGSAALPYSSPAPRFPICSPPPTLRLPSLSPSCGSYEGFHGLSPAFTIVHASYAAANSLPRAHTCFNKLDLPEYSTYDMLTDKLTYAINEGSEGFGFE